MFLSFFSRLKGKGNGVEDLYLMRKKILAIRFIPMLFFLTIAFESVTSANAKTIDLSNAEIVISSDIKPQIRNTSYKILTEEVNIRTSIFLKKVSNWSSNNVKIALALSSTEKLFGKDVPKRSGADLPELKSEGFRVYLETKNGLTILWIIGADSRGVLFGIGEFLRNAEMKENSISLSNLFDHASSPVYSIRGHQLGYRNTANSYDAWSVEQYEKYIRELVIFGHNAIENIPPRSKGETDKSVHFKLSRKEMNIELGKICNAYDINYWVWTPATIDLKDESLRQKEIERLDEFYQECPRLDDVFFPGGDPGHNHPREVMPYLKELQLRLTKYHPNAGMWISLQGFSEEMVDYFYKYLEDEKPDWLRGVVSGPSSPPIAETRFRLPKQYKHRQYPDITHNVRCEFPTMNFDQAHALTIGREGINPQPIHYSKIHKDYAQFTDGFVTYSDGCHDDVNKIIWGQRGWNPEKSIREILIEYSRFFFGPELEFKAAEGILALENNWVGPLENNGSVETTFIFWNNLENNHPELNDNWRWEMLLLRANFDTYTRRRLLNEKKLEKEANKILAKVDELGIEKAMKKSLQKISEAETNPIDKNIKTKIENYCQNLFELIGLQTSVELYNASGAQRGAFLDFVDYPLNNRWWYEDEFNKIRKMKSEQEKKERLEIIRTWENPGTGSYYDDISNIANSPHVTTTVYDAVDFAWLNGGFSRLRLSSQVYQNDPILEYENLDPNARYLIRIAGYGDALLRINGKRMEPILYNKEVGAFKEFVVPRNSVGNGRITVTFDQPEESQINWRKYSRISDVWLIKR